MWSVFRKNGFERMLASFCLERKADSAGIELTPPNEPSTAPSRGTGIWKIRCFGKIDIAIPASGCCDADGIQCPSANTSVWKDPTYYLLI